MRRSIEVARAGVYNMRIHHDNVVLPLLNYWAVGDMTGLDKKGQELQDKIMALPSQLIRKAERFEARFA